MRRVFHLKALHTTLSRKSLVAAFVIAQSILNIYTRRSVEEERSIGPFRAMRIEFSSVSLYFSSRRRNKITLTYALLVLVERLFSCNILSHTVRLLTNRTTRADNCRATVNPTNSVSAISRLKKLTQIAGHNVTFDIRVAIISNTNRAFQLLHISQLLIEKVHTSSVPFGIIHDRLNAFRPCFLKLYGLSAIGFSDNRFGSFRRWNNFNVVFFRL